jgi:hypothetical protein
VSTNAKPKSQRPKVHIRPVHSVHKDIHHPDLFRGWDETRSCTLAFQTDFLIPNWALHDLKVEFVWKRTHDAEKRITDAQVYITQAGFGWSKLETRGGGKGFEGSIRVQGGHIILFEHMYTVVVPAVPLGEFIEKLHMENRWPAIIHGALDVKTGYMKAELKWR